MEMAYLRVLLVCTLIAAEDPRGYLNNLSYRQLIGTSRQCIQCTASWTTYPVFCNIVAAPLPKYKTYIAKVFDENDPNDPCYCEKIGSIFYAREPGRPACTIIPNVCETLNKKELCTRLGRMACDGSQWSTFHCICKQGRQGQICSIPTSEGEIVKTPILVNYLNAPLFQTRLSPKIPIVPGLYFITENLGEDFLLIVAFDDGRKIKVGPSDFDRKNFRDDCFTDIREKIHYISEYYCDFIPEGYVYGYGIFLDKMLNVDLDAPDNLKSINSSYRLRSVGRFASLEVVVKNKNRVTWKWERFDVFVPYQRHFILGSRHIQIQGCGEDQTLPPSKSVAEPIILRASYDHWSWFRNLVKPFSIEDHRWYIEDITDPEEMDDMIPARRLPIRYSHGVYGRVKMIPRGELGIGKYLVVFDFIQKWLGREPIDTQYVTRKLCYFDVVGATKMEVYLHTRSKSNPCKDPLIIEVVNYNSLYYDNSDLKISWKCEGSNTPECVEKETHGVEPYKNVLKCGVQYKFTATVTHAKSSDILVYQVDVFSENQNSTVEIECVKSCGYKVNPDRFLYLQAIEIPPVSSSWKWEIREVIRDEDGQEKTGDDIITRLRQPLTENHILIIPPDKLTPAKEYRVYARTPSAFSSYSFITNEPPKGGTCVVEPSSGVSLETEFRIVCKNWEDEDEPLKFRVLEIPDRTKAEASTLACSESYVIDKLKFRHPEMTVLIIDSKGLSTQHNLTIKLSKPSTTINEDYVTQSIANITAKMAGNAQVQALNTLDVLTKMIEEQKLIISETVLIRLLQVLGNIDAFDDICSLQKGLDVLNRILNFKTADPKLQCNNKLMAGSEILKHFAEIANDFEEAKKINLMFDKNAIASSISEASCSILLEQDPVVEQNNATEEVLEEHIYGMDKATENALNSMTLLGSFLTKSVEYQMRKYVVRKSCFNILGKFGNGSQIRDELYNIIDFPYEFYKNRSSNTAVIDLTNDTLWGIPNEIGLLGVVTQFSNDTGPLKGPIEFALQVPNYQKRFATVAGNYQSILACPTEAKLDKNLNIHHILLPDGDGVVIINFPSDVIGKVNVFARQSERPTYANVTSSPPLNSSVLYVKFSNRNHALQSSFYMAVIPINQSVINYTFTYRVLRCAIYTGSQFISRGCTFDKMIIVSRDQEPIVHCRCNLSSDASSSTTWLSVNIITPHHSLILSSDIYLFSMVLENFYTALIVAFVLCTLAVVLVWGYRLDCIDERCRKIIFMEDNYPGDDHAYVIAVFTGQGIGSGTSSRVAIRVFGNSGTSRVHMLQHRGRRTLAAGRDDWFLMTTAVHLGPITKIQIWHNHAGRSPEWYCKKISIFDLESHNKYDFIIERWFTFDIRIPLYEARMYEGQVATQAEVSKKWYLLVGGWVYSEMREKHHLASIFRRHPRSLYTRCQRVIISVTFITTTMLVSMMFFKLDEVGPADWPVIPFKLNNIWTGIKSSIISSLITSAVVLCFGLHKKYERACLKAGPNFEVPEEPDEVTESGPAVMPIAGKKRKWIPSFHGVCIKVIKPNPIEYKPVTFGVTGQKSNSVSLTFLIVGWVLALLTISINSFFVVLYGLKFGPKKSLVWVLTFLTGTFSNGIIFAPMKMVVLGLIVALTFKRSYLDSFTMQIQFNSSKLANRDNTERLKMNFHLRLKSHYKPTPTVELEIMRSRKLKGREFSYLLTHTVMVSLLFAIVMLLVILFGIQEGFYHIRQLKELLTGGKSAGSAYQVWNAKT